jgi:hypothetical protein
VQKGLKGLMMKKVRVEDAIGHVLCHDLTRIVKDEMKGPQFRKGHIVQQEDIPMLLSMGKEHLFVWEKTAGMVHENDAAERLAKICRSAHMKQGGVSEGKIELTAECRGLFRVDVARLNAVNAIDDIAIATRHSLSPVQKDDKLAGMRVIPLVIGEERLAQVEAAAGKEPLLELLPYTAHTACLVTTGSEIAAGRVKDTFTPVVKEKLAAYDIGVKKQFMAGDDKDNIAAAINDARAEKPDMILCTGGMSVDPDDNTPGAIAKSGAHIVTYGTPVLPGNMFMLGYFDDGCAIMGLPGCVMYAHASIFDIVLPRVAAGVHMTKQDFTTMGNGGLCLSCPECRYPVCPYGK